MFRRARDLAQRHDKISGETIKPKTLQSILKQAGMTVAEFQELL